jgi:hypothetical protein
MNYEEHPKTEKFVGSMAFYAIIALSLIAIGVIAWFMVSRKADDMEPKGDISAPSESYNSENESYNDISDMSPDRNTSEIVENPVSDIPYTENTPESAPITPPKRISTINSHVNAKLPPTKANKSPLKQVNASPTAIPLSQPF